MADKPPGQVGRKEQPRVKNQPANGGPNNGVPPATKDQHPMGSPTSHRLKTETAAGEKDKDRQEADQKR